MSLILGAPTMRRRVARPAAPIAITDPNHPDLVLFYTCDSADISGSTHTDLSSAANHGTITGAVVQASGGVVGDALSFDGVDDQIAVPADASLQLSTWSISARFNCDVTPNGSALVAEAHVGAGDKINFTLGFCDGALGSVAGSRLFVGGFNGSSWHGVAHGSTLANTTWHHVVGTYDGSDFYLYINDSQSGTVSHTGDFTDVESVYVGRRWDTTGAAKGVASFFDGSMDLVRIFNRALTADEVGQLNAEGV